MRAMVLRAGTYRIPLNEVLLVILQIIVLLWALNRYLSYLRSSSWVLLVCIHRILDSVWILLLLFNLPNRHWSLLYLLLKFVGVVDIRNRNIEAVST